MAILTVPTGSEIYLEIDGKRAAAVESYSARASRKTTVIEQLGSSEPVCAVQGALSYALILKRVRMNDSMDFHKLSDFTVVIAKPDMRIIYTGCEWSDIKESTNAGGPCIEEVTLTAASRTIV